MQKTAYEMRISDWSSDVCSSDLVRSPDDDRILAREIAELVLEQHQAAQRCARHETLEPGRESPSIDRMEAVDLLVGVDPGDDRLFVDMLGKRKLDEDVIDRGVGVERIAQRAQSGLAGGRGRAGVDTRHTP